MIYITGDTHGGFQRFTTGNFPQQKQMGRNDYVIICGDFGGVWDGSPREAYCSTGWRKSRLPPFLRMGTTRILPC